MYRNRTRKVDKTTDASMHTVVEREECTEEQEDEQEEVDENDAGNKYEISRRGQK